MSLEPLSESCDIVQGGRLKLTGDDFVPEGYPAYGAGGLNGRLLTYEFDRTAIVLSSIGARCGKCFYASGRWTSLANTQVILPKSERVDPKFLWFQLNNEARWPRSGSAQPFIKPSDVKRSLIFRPPLDEQRRIATILDQADALRCKRREVLAKLQILREALFTTTFTLDGSYEWPISSIGEVSLDARTGPFGSDLLHSEFVDEGIAVLGIDNAVTNKFTWSQLRFITPKKYEKLRRYTVRPGDLVITIMGTCGRCAVVPDDIPLAINTKHLCCLSLDQSRILPSYLHCAFLNEPNLLKQLGVQAKGAVMPGLNSGIIKKLTLRIPPLVLQEHFEAELVLLGRLEEGTLQHLASLDELFATLQHCAFAGETKSPTKETLEAMAEADKLLKSGKSRFANAAEMFASLEKPSGG